jgi:hypothetical protein
MQLFIAKFEKEIQGVMSDFDRVLFRGSLRRLNHSKGMKCSESARDLLFVVAAVDMFDQQVLPMKRLQRWLKTTSSASSTKTM